jgi:ribose transport system substrate-binding protein
MKKKAVFSITLTLIILSATPLFAGGGKEKGQGDQKTVKINYTIIELANPFWSAFNIKMSELCKNKGWQFNVLDGGANSGTQINQIENFISSGTDIIVVQPIDPTFITQDLVDAAHAKGTVMMGHGVAYPTADTNWVDDNEGCGKAVGYAAAKWSKERYGDEEVEAALLEFPYVKEAVDRTVGIKAALTETKSKIKIVATASAAGLPDGMTAAETMFQAHPNVKIFLTISDGQALGACEMLESKGVNPNDYAVFGIDATQEALTKIMSNTPFKMTVSKGTPEDNALGIMKVFEAILAGKYEKRYVTPTITVDETNVRDYLSK